MSNYNRVNRVLIGDGVNTTPLTVLPQIQKGDLVLVSETGAVIQTTAAAIALSKFSRVQVGAGIGPGNVILSSPIQGNHVSSFKGKGYTAPVAQVTYVGYDPIIATGSLGVDADSEYRLRILIKDSHWVSGMRQTMMDYFYNSDSTPTQAEAAYVIACQYQQKDYGINYMYDKVLLERTADGTATALAAAATVIKESRTVTITGHGLTQGTVIRLANAAYVIKQVVDANTIKLDIPYKGASGSIAAGTSATTGASLAGSANWGFRLTGLPQTSRLDKGVISNVDEYEWIVFDVSYAKPADRSVLSSALVTYDTATDPGIGYWKEVRDIEEKAKGYWGDTSKRRFDDYRIESQTVVGTTYVQIIIEYADRVNGDYQDDYREPLALQIYIPVGSSQADLTAGNNQFAAILNGFLSGSVGFPALTFA